MRHLVFGKKLGRDTNSRKALLANLATSLIVNGFVKTTQAKANFARPYVEELISRAKDKKLSNTRKLAPLVSNQAFKKLTAEIAPGFISRSGGYTRIIKLGYRLGDRASMARLELLEWEKSRPQPKAPRPLDEKPTKTAEAKTK